MSGASERNEKEQIIPDPCSHSDLLDDMCLQCGKTILKDGDDENLQYRFMPLGIEFTASEIDRLCNIHTSRALSKGKLFLVLDLDNTMLETISMSSLTLEELSTRSESLKGDIFYSFMNEYATKLRPFAQTFLKEANKLFDMYIYTMGGLIYAQQMAFYLDPADLYFTSKVISIEHNTVTDQKGLDIVLGLNSTIVILDDQKDVWVDNLDNVIEVLSYHYFRSTTPGPSCYSESNTDEDESNGILAGLLEVLQKIHKNFFAPPKPGEKYDLSIRDVSLVIEEIRKTVLADCNIVIAVPNEQKSKLWRLATQMGALCYDEVELDEVKVREFITHIVTTDAASGVSKWAIKQHKYLVNPVWIVAAHFIWIKQREETAPVRQ